ncbi:MAG: DUF5666 domain-containing protein [Pseudomonadales bacterium]
MSAVRVLLRLYLLFALAACGGGGGSEAPLVADTGVGGSGGAVGPAQGFGSILINDLVLDIDDAEFEIEGAPAGIGRSGQNQLAEGQQLVIRGDIGAGEASEVFYRSDIRGPLAALPVFDPLTGVGELSLLGQTVRVGAVTRYAGGAALDLLQAGDLLEVSGVRNAAGALVATYVERKSALAEYKVVGRVTAIAAPGFSVNGLVVDVQTNGLATPAAGDRVEVRFASATFTSGDPVVAIRVDALDDVELDDGERYDIQGIIDDFTSATRFTVSGVVVVVPAGATFEDGNAGDLGLDVRVEVEGDANAAGELVAERIQFRRTEAIRFEGTVSAVDAAAGKVTTAVGVTFVVRELTELEDESSLGVDPFTLADLGAGDFVEARGFLDGAEVVAAEIEREDFDAETRLRAPADAAPVIDGGGDLRLDLLGVPVLASPGTTVFEDDDDNAISRDEFAALVSRGTVVEAQWDAFSGTAQAVDSLSIEEEDD